MATAYKAPDLESAKCAVCGVDNSRKLFTKDGFTMVKCRACGLAYVNPRLRSDVLAGMYEKDELDPFDYLLQNRDADSRTFERRVAVLEKYSKKGVLLDIGCGIGVLLSVARKRGWNVRGVELTKQFTDYCKKQGLDVAQGTAESVKLSHAAFDAVTMTGSIEHMPNPLKALKAARAVLKKSGTLLLTTPDIGSLHARILGKHWLQLKPKEHIYYFSPETMRALLAKAGFETIETSHVSNCRNLKTLVEKLGIYAKPLSSLLRAIIPDSKSKNIYMDFNPHDEMMVIARAV